MIQKTGNPETFLCHDFKMCSKMVVKEEVVLTALRHNVDETTPIQPVSRLSFEKDRSDFLMVFTFCFTIFYSVIW